MPEEQFIDPKELRKSGKISFDDIPLNQYDKTIEEEKDNYSKDELIGIYRDMTLIREFETMVQGMKTSSEYNGIEYNYLGPSHLYFGEEAAAVGQAFVLDINDYILGSHRSHGEILAKGLSAIEKLSDNELMQVMEDFRDGELLKIVEENQNYDNVKELAINFLLYGVSAEIFAKDTGFNRGLGGSMHAFFTPFGIYPNNAIVGGSAPISTGIALYKKIRKEKGVVVANIGDGSLGCGPVWESLNFAAMRQMKELWDEEYRGGLPIIFNFMDNQYGMGGQTAGETMAFDILARVGAGVNKEQMHAERIDGYNPLAVIEGVKRKKKLIKEKEGPILLDTLTYRLGGHSTSDSNAYRTKEEIQAWEENDCIMTYKEDLIKAGIAKEDEFEQIDKEIKERMTEICKIAVDMDISPRMKNPEEIEDLMFSDKKVKKMAEEECEVLKPKEENSRIKR
ncbi:MAG: thiamine pyrophosphate-dependent dehydrogenase E1 component subunit alpha, partial [Bacillota bacterium]